VYPGAHHDSQFPARTPSSAIAWLNDRRRDSNPVHVSYTTDPLVLAHVDPSLLNADYGLTYDRAYWVSGVRPADVHRPAMVDARTKGLGRVEAGTSPYAGTGSDEAGVYVTKGRTRGPAATVPRRNAFRFRLENVGEVTFDLARMGIDPDEPFAMDGSTTTVAVVHLLHPDGTTTDYHIVP
jgi:hypothetical protein